MRRLDEDEGEEEKETSEDRGGASCEVLMCLRRGAEHAHGQRDEGLSDRPCVGSSPLLCSRREPSQEMKGGDVTGRGYEVVS